ncbi:MAG: hypothetical protein VB957_10230 [Pseudomonadales bacterium]
MASELETLEKGIARAPAIHFCGDPAQSINRRKRRQTAFLDAQRCTNLGIYDHEKPISPSHD